MLAVGSPIGSVLVLVTGGLEVVEVVDVVELVVDELLELHPFWHPAPQCYSGSVCSRCITFSEVLTPGVFPQ